MGKKKNKVVEIKMKDKSEIRKLKRENIIAILIILLLTVIGYYLFLPAMNIQSAGFWFLLMDVILFVFLATFAYTSDGTYQTKLNKFVMYVFIIGIVCLFIGIISSLKIFSSSKYAALLTVEDGNFETDIVEADSISDIAIMDTQTAIIIGNRAIGSLTDIVSQFVVSEDYSQIDYNGRPMKVAPLNYAGFIKYLNNKNDGIPGYVMVDPVSNEAVYVKLDRPMKYVPSAYFGYDLGRHLRIQYPTFIFNGYCFELDAEGNPYYICPVLESKVGMFGAKDIKGIVICDPCTGNSQYYDVANVPAWVDRVYDGDLLTKHYDWYGKLSGGYWNSIFGNKGCKVTTDDYGYKVIDGDVWIYTGVTSVNADESNIGFVLMNQRTAQVKYYQIAGAEEYSAMSSAQGEVQHLGYVAAFPSLINIGGEPTYIMALKDEAGLVKMYALVNVAKYNIVATGSSQREALAAYKKMMKENGLTISATAQDEMTNRRITIESIRFIEITGDTYVYITDEQGNVYKQNFSENESLIFLKEGDSITIYYEENEDGIHNLTSYK